MAENSSDLLNEFTNKEYEYGFTTDIHTDFIAKGLNEEIICVISAKKEEPEWLLDFRLKAFRHWQTLEMPSWAHLQIPPIDY
ncbi:MAG: Fe-S cluster assembly protein SufB, partial [Dysgonamonadaceae bacterium]|nr:Fe-S cluster assembly protein SufB [Dysgonamonadaceae bacterium]